MLIRPSAVHLSSFSYGLRPRLLQPRRTPCACGSLSSPGFPGWLHPPNSESLFSTWRVPVGRFLEICAPSSPSEVSPALTVLGMVFLSVPELDRSPLALLLSAPPDSVPGTPEEPRDYRTKDQSHVFISCENAGRWGICAHFSFLEPSQVCIMAIILTTLYQRPAPCMPCAL